MNGEHIYVVLREVSEYFSRSDYELEILLLLLTPIVLISFVAYFHKGFKGTYSAESSLNKRDFELIEMVRKTKRLEEFDRDFLLELAIENSIKPPYLPFIDKKSINKLEKELLKKAKHDNQKTESERLRLFRQIKQSLFN